MLRLQYQKIHNTLMNFIQISVNFLTGIILEQRAFNFVKSGPLLSEKGLKIFCNVPFYSSTNHLHHHKAGFRHRHFPFSFLSEAFISLCGTPAFFSLSCPPPQTNQLHRNCHEGEGVGVWHHRWRQPLANELWLWGGRLHSSCIGRLPRH